MKLRGLQGAVPLQGVRSMQSTPSKTQSELASKGAHASLTPATEAVQAVPAGALSTEAVAATAQAAPIVVGLPKGSTVRARKRIKETAQRNGVNLRVPKRIHEDANTAISTFEVCGNRQSKDCDNQVKVASTGGGRDRGELHCTSTLVT